MHLLVKLLSVCLVNVVLGEFGPHWERKMHTWFNDIEVDGDGVISAEDFDLISSRWAQAGNLNAEDAEYLRQEWARIFRTYFSPNGINTDFQGFLNQVKTHTKVDYLRETDPFFHMFFDIIDTDNDGSITSKEFYVYLYACGLHTREEAQESFDHLDTDHDGTLTLEEFVDAGNKFPQLEEDDPSDWVWGPLV